MHYFYLTLLVLHLKAIHGSIYSNLKENVKSVSDTTRTDNEGTYSIPILRVLMNYFQVKKQDDAIDKKSIQNKADVLKNMAHDTDLNIGRSMPSSKFTRTTGSNDKNIGRNYFHIDPVFNSLKNRRLWKKEKNEQGDSTRSSSSEMEVQAWKQDWAEKRLLKKFEAMNSSQPRGDVVNMKAARPWGFQCGDPNQYDLPWGTCMLPEECDAEYRIYRGDSFCGRNEFICCALERTAYDMYQGLDLSFQHEDSLSTDTEDERNKDLHMAKEHDRKKRRHEKNRKKRMKAQLKKKIRISIRNIITEITKLLQKAYRNGTAQRTKKTNELKEFIKKMKKQYRKDRKTLVDLHEFNMANYETKLAESLGKVSGMNEAFMSNDTFRDIVVNGTVNMENLLRLQRTHPLLSLFFNHRRMGEEMGGDLEAEPEKIKLETEREVPEPEHIKLETDGEVPEPKNIKLDTEGEVPEPEHIKLETDGEVPEPENIKLETDGEVPEPENIKLETEKEKPKLLEYDLEYGIL